MGLAMGSAMAVARAGPGLGRPCEAGGGGGAIDGGGGGGGAAH